MSFQTATRALIAAVLFTAGTQSSVHVSAAQPAADRCEKCDFDTAIDWVVDPDDAFQLARREQRPVLVLHLSGNFAKSEFT